jgi:hypothetical protein
VIELPPSLIGGVNDTLTEPALIACTVPITGAEGVRTELSVIIKGITAEYTEKITVSSPSVIPSLVNTKLVVEVPLLIKKFPVKLAPLRSLVVILVPEITYGTSVPLAILVVLSVTEIGDPSSVLKFNDEIVYVAEVVTVVCPG